jgi:hypothetical protein
MAMHYIHNRFCTVFTGFFVLMKHTNLMIAPIFIRSETLSLKRNSKKTSRVIIALKKTSRVYMKTKTASVTLKKKNPSVMVKKNGECLQSWPFSTIVAYASLDSINGKG